MACITATFGARRSSTPAGLPRHRPAPLVPLFLLAILRAPENLVSAGNVDIGRAWTLRGLVPVAIVFSLSDEEGRPSSEPDPVLAKDNAPTGSLTFMLTLNGAAMGLLYRRSAYPLAPVASLAVAGVVADVLRALLRPGADRPLAWRIFSFVVPSVTALAYFASLALTRGVWWSVHVWSGTVLLSGAVGWLLGYVALPPGRPPLAAAEAKLPSAVRSSADSDVPVAIGRGSSS